MNNSSNNLENDTIDLGIKNGNIPKEFYSQNPCTIGYSYIRFEVDGNIRPCCISKYEIGNTEIDWRRTWHSNAYAIFRQKTFKINSEKMHLNDPDWLFCQQCSHMHLNIKNLKILKARSLE